MTVKGCCDGEPHRVVDALFETIAAAGKLSDAARG
jgi:hypothetical protein